MQGRDLVAEEALRRGEFVLRLDEASLGGEHRTESCRRVGPEPASTRPDPPHRRPRLLGVTSCGGEPSALDGDEGERRAGDHEARDSPLDRRMLKRPHRHRPRLVKLPREEQRASVGGQRSGQDLVRASLRERDRTPAVEHRLAHAAVDRDRAHQPRRRPDVITGSLRAFSTFARSASCKHPALLDRSPADEHRGSGGRHRKLRMLDDHLVRKRANPAQQRPAGAPSDQRQVILDQKLRDELVVDGRSRVRDRLGRQPSRSKALGCSSVDPRRRARIEPSRAEPAHIPRTKSESGTSRLAPTARRTGSSARARRAATPNPSGRARHRRALR